MSRKNPTSPLLIPLKNTKKTYNNETTCYCESASGGEAISCCLLEITYGIASSLSLLAMTVYFASFRGLLLFLTLFTLFWLTPLSAQTGKTSAQEDFVHLLAHAVESIKQGKYDNALVAFDKALEIKPDDYKAWAHKAQLLDQIGRYKEAVEAYDKATSLNPLFYEAWINKGLALVRV